MENRYCPGCGRDMPLASFRAERRECATCRYAPTKREAPLPAPDPTPAKRLRQELERRRKDGQDFQTAWSYALASACATEASWLPVLQWSKREWQLAYERAGKPCVRPSALRVA
jgi:hypothetical protein